jgi:dTDP-4-dehydrorhamnose reductase
MAKKTSIIVLGKTGMLGSMVYIYLKKNKNFKVIGTQRNESKDIDIKFFDVPEFIADQDKFNFLKKADHIINCIGIIKPYCKDNDPEGVVKAIQVNALFPHILSKFLERSKTKVIQIATDCVYSGLVGAYLENAPHDALDVYGKTKSLGEVQANNLLNIRCSIIGPEIKGKLSLLEWFLSQAEGAEITGFENHLWNGITTLQFAQLCEMIISKSLFEALCKESKVHHYTPNSTVNKYELLNIFKDAFKKKVKITKGNAPVSVDRTLKTQLKLLLNNYQPVIMTDALRALVLFMNKNILA